MDTLVVYPVSGWWKYKEAQNRSANQVRYSLLISIEVPEENVDIYSEIENIILNDTDSAVIYASNHNVLDTLRQTDLNQTANG